MTESTEGKKKNCTRLSVNRSITSGHRAKDDDLQDRGDQVFLACDKKLYVKNYVKYESWNDVTEGERIACGLKKTKKREKGMLMPRASETIIRSGAICE